MTLPTAPFAGAVLLLALATVRMAEAQVTLGATASVSLAADSLESIFQLRCAFCHGADSEHAPARSAVAARSVEAIAAALTTGVMRPMAGDLSEAEIQALARHLSTAGPAPAAEIVGTGDLAYCARRDVSPRPVAVGDWNGWGRDTESTRFQPDPGFAASDIPRLRVKWAFALDGGIHSQPTVAGGRVFVTSVPGRLYSLDVETGCMYWSYQTASGDGDYWGGAGSRSTVVVGTVPDSAPGRFAAFLGDDMGFVHAVDVRSGEAIWRTRVDEHPVARLTGSPVLHDGILYVPVSSLEEGWAGSADYGCCTFRGSLVALDAATGEIVWKSYTIPEEAQPYRLSETGVQQYGPAGAPIWSTPTLDPERGVIYAATGNSYTDLPNSGSNAIVAFELETGRIRWLRQLREGDNFVTGCPDGANCPENVGPDYDFGSSPILRSLPDDTSLLVVADKSGQVYGIDPDHEGEVRWSTKIGHGSSLGGVEWGFAADDALVYLAVSDYVAPPELRRPGMTALRLTDGEVVWHTPAPPAFCSWPDGIRCSNAHSAAVTLVPGAVFAGALDGHIRAYSTADGSVLWDFDTARWYPTVGGALAEGGSLDGGGPTVAGGTLFLASGYSRFGRKPGNVLLAFTPGGR